MIGIEKVVSTSGEDPLTKARKYEFLNQLVLVNPVFNQFPYKDYEVEDDYIYKWAYRTGISAARHIHIFMGSTNVTIANLMDMMNFIGMVNKVCKYPVYIHMPKTCRETAKAIVILLNGRAFRGVPLRYRVIMERDSLVTKFNYGNDWKPVDGAIHSVYFPKCWLYVSWDKGGFARPAFYSAEKDILKEVFSND